MTAALSRQAGFTLIEMVVALAIAGMVLAAGFQAFSSGLRTLGAAERYARVALAAQSILAGAGVEQPLAPGTSSGDFPPDLTWSLDVTRTEDPTLPPGTAAQEDGVPLYRLDLVLRWPPEGEARFSTLRLGKPDEETAPGAAE